MKYRILWILVFMMPALPGQAEKLHCPSPGTDDEANREIARRFFRMGSTYVGKDHRKTTEYFGCVLKLVPYSLSARYQFAKALDALKQYSRARESYELILSDTSVEATKYHEEIRERLNQIAKLPDEPLPPDEDETEEDSSYHEKMRIQQERIRKLEEEQKRAKQQMEEQLKNLEAQGGDMEARRKQILEEYKKKEAEKIRELELQLERLRKLEIQMHSVAGPKYKEVSRPLRKAGMWVAGGGLLLGAGSAIFGFMYWNKYNSIQMDSDKKKWTPDIETPILWSTSKIKSERDQLITLSNWSIYLGVSAGLVTIAGIIMYAVGGSDRVLVSGSVQDKPHSWRILPAAGPEGAGIFIQTSW